MNKASLLNERQSRINKAMALERPDRTPVVLLYTLFAAKVTGQPFSEFCQSIDKSAEAMIKAFEMCGDADGTDYIGFLTYGLSFIWMSKVKIPGKDLPEDVSYQVDEAEVMKVEDYDTILDKGWMDFFFDFMQTRVVEDVDPDLLPMNQPPFNAKGVCDPLGIPVLTPGAPLATPFDVLCGGRSLAPFIHDLFTIPDKVEAVMDLMASTFYGLFIDMAIAGGYPAIWVGGWRSASTNLSPKLWDRFVWPYYSRLANEVIDAGLMAILHLDSDWTRDLARFRELPKGKCVLATDGMTDIFKAKEILGDHMCIMGDVPATMLSMGTPDEVYEYSTKLIKELGPEGFILHSGCDIPANAKLENVKAMISAATGK
jgi:uroporphyrinogen-III decarboxylase